MATEAARVDLDRELLRRVGEHLCTLAERALEQHYLSPKSSRLYDRYLKLSRLSREVLELLR